MGIETMLPVGLKASDDKIINDTRSIIEYKKEETPYLGPQVALAQHSVKYCGDGMGDGCVQD